jgi:hypothetical protein
LLLLPMLLLLLLLHLDVRYESQASNRARLIPAAQHTCQPINKTLIRQRWEWNRKHAANKGYDRVLLHGAAAAARAERKAVGSSVSPGAAFNAYGRCECAVDN